MCLGVPGQIIEIQGEDDLLRAGRVSFGGVTRLVNLAYVPEAKIGDYVIVHVGFAISQIDEEEANEIFRFLEGMGDLDELQDGS